MERPSGTVSSAFLPYAPHGSIIVVRRVVLSFDHTTSSSISFFFFIFFFFFELRLLFCTKHYSFESKLNDEYFYSSLRIGIKISVVSLLRRKKCFFMDKMCFKFFEHWRIFSLFSWSLNHISLNHWFPSAVNFIHLLTVGVNSVILDNF